MILRFSIDIIRLFLLLAFITDDALPAPVKVGKVLISNIKPLGVFLTIATKAAVAMTPIPVEISSLDERSYTPLSQMQQASPIESLDGGFNLGIGLWAFVSYQGLFTTIGRPAEWILSPLVKLLRPNSENETWFVDYRDGYAFTVPPDIEVVRVSIFLALGYLVNTFLIRLLDGDEYWGWAISGSLVIPVGFFALVRNSEKISTRAEGEQERQMLTDFKEFAASRLSYIKDSSCPEDRLILAFRRSFLAYRDDKIVSDKTVRRILRAYLRRKPQNGAYRGIELSNISKENRVKLEENLKRAEEARKLYLQTLGDSKNTAEEQALVLNNGDEDASTTGSDFIRF